MVSTIFFPLRSNAKSLLVGRHLEAVRSRIKTAALLHDQVFIEGGEWSVYAGGTGSSALWNPKPSEWQTARERNALKGKMFWITAAPSNARPSTPPSTVVQSEMTICWRATF